MTTPNKPQPSKSQSDNPPPPAQSNAPAPEKAPAPGKRTRSALSMEKRLALAILAILAAFDAKPADAGTIKEKLEAARTLVKDVNEKFIKPTQDRIAVLKTEIEAAFKASEYGKIKELSSELVKLEVKLKTATTA